MAVFKFSVIKPLKLNIFKNKLDNVKVTSFKMIIIEKIITRAFAKPEL